MCGMCSDTLGFCREAECEAYPGRRRLFSWGEIPCRHVLAEHDADCTVRSGCLCDCH
jgi:hypothetical protein